MTNVWIFLLVDWLALIMNHSWPWRGSWHIVLHVIAWYPRPTIPFFPQVKTINNHMLLIIDMNDSKDMIYKGKHVYEVWTQFSGGVHRQQWWDSQHPINLQNLYWVPRTSLLVMRCTKTPQVISKFDTLVPNCNLFEVTRGFFVTILLLIPLSTFYCWELCNSTTK